VRKQEGFRENRVGQGLGPGGQNEKDRGRINLVTGYTCIGKLFKKQGVF